MLIYKRLCLVLPREMVSCGGAGKFWPSTLEVGNNVERKAKTHMSGAVDVL